MTLFADFLGDVALVLIMWCVIVILLIRALARSTTASTLAMKAGKGFMQKALEGFFKKH
jgi:hypothetical protein